MTHCSIQDQTLRLLHQKAVFWEEEKCLIISDLHLGKGHHFRKGGVALPKAGDHQNLHRMRSLLEVLQPGTLLLLGDLFHSAENAHVGEVARFFDTYPDLCKKLVIGNHDIMDVATYASMGLELSEADLDWGPFRFTHEPAAVESACADADDVTHGATSAGPSEAGSDSRYTICGHVHPGIRLRGRGRQSVMLPCYWFGERQAVLPAFGNFTGLYRIHPRKNDRVFAIAERRIVDLSAAG